MIGVWLEGSFEKEEHSEIRWWSAVLALSTKPRHFEWPVCGGVTKTDHFYSSHRRIEVCSASRCMQKQFSEE